MEFYATAAQVIPVLLLVLVVEFRLFGGNEASGGWWASARELAPGERISTLTALWVVGYLLLFFFAEMLSLDALRNRSAPEYAEAVVWAALFLGFLMVIFVPVQPYIETLLDRTPAYRLKVWFWRRTGELDHDAPDPPKAGEGPPVAATPDEPGPHRDSPRRDPGKPRTRRRRRRRQR